MKIITLLLFVVSSASALAQSVNQTPTRKQDVLNRLNNGMSTNDIVNGIPQKGGVIEGTIYLNEQWFPGVIKLKFYDEPINVDKLRINVFNNEVELQVDGKIKVVGAHEIIYCSINEGYRKRYFVSTMEYPVETNLTGFFEVLYDAPTSLLAHYYTAIKKADYNVALDVGSKNDEILIKENYYVVKENAPLIKVDKRKDVLKICSDFASQMKSFIKNNNLKTSNSKDLVEIFKYYNTLH